MALTDLLHGVDPFGMAKTAGGEAALGSTETTEDLAAGVDGVQGVAALVRAYKAYQGGNTAELSQDIISAGGEGLNAYARAQIAKNPSFVSRVTEGLALKAAQYVGRKYIAPLLAAEFAKLDPHRAGPLPAETKAPAPTQTQGLVRLPGAAA